MREQSERCIEAYKVNPLLIDEHANIERATAQGGYGRRQVYELIQNGADALLGHAGGEIRIRLTAGFLYCANEGKPIDGVGVEAILSSHLSVKRGNEIGRFGLGFKSVLGVTDKPQFFSRSGSFGFNAASAAQRIRAIRPGAERVPVLRLATPLDAEVAARSDPDLLALMEWATTVVRLPLQPSTSEWLGDDLRKFPAEFLLFSHHVGKVRLENAVDGLVREMHLTPFQDRYLLTEGRHESVWRSFEIKHHPTDQARKDAGELADREVLPVVWAVPLSGGRQARGNFWAFFPTGDFTTLSGIVNAPWKTNEDRRNLLPGAFNEELIDVVARLVTDSLPALVDSQDPGAVLDLLPARGREAPNWADDTLTQRIYHLAADRPSLPDQRGVLVVPNSLQVHPQGASKAALEAWAAFGSKPVAWCHASVETIQRRARVDRLIGSGRQSTYAEWLEALVAEGSVDASIAALTAARLADDPPESARHQELISARIVLTESGEFAPPLAGTIFTGAASETADVAYVHRAVQANPEAIAALDHFGIRPLDPLGELTSWIINARQEADLSWESFWDLSRRSAPAVVAQLLVDHGFATRVHAKTVSGAFAILRDCLLPGPITPSDGSRDAEVAIDTDFHGQDLGLLELLGATPAPIADRGDEEEVWFARYRSDSIDKFMSEAARDGKRPVRDYTEVDGADFVGPLSPLLHLSDEGRKRFTEAVLASDVEFRPWTARHRTNPANYPQISLPNPALWFIRRHGALETSLGTRDVQRAVAGTLGEWRQFLPVSELSAASAAWLEMPASLAELSEPMWLDAFAAALSSQDDSKLGAFYAQASGHRPAPQKIRARVGTFFGDSPPSATIVVTSRTQLEALAAQSLPTLLVPDPASAAALVDRWQLRRAETVMRTRVDAIPLTDATPLIDEFPALEAHLPADRRAVELIRCAELRQETLTEHGTSSAPADFLVDGNRIYWNNAFGDDQLLPHIVGEFGLHLTESDIDDIIGRRADRSRRDLLVQIRKQSDLTTRFLAAVPPDLIRRRLSATLIEATEDSRGPLTDLDLGRLAHAVYGVELLHEFRQELTECGLQPPQQWAGGRAARAFVRELGFPNEYAGFEQARRDALLEVDGPPNLPDLHEFQAMITARIRELLGSTAGRRGLLSLPTGAGKTRVAVQALIEAIRDHDLSGPILWVAQTDELCEQAVQAWSEVWRSFGPREQMKISRLWDINEAEEFSEATQVVIATDAKLAGCLSDPNYAWLSRATCVVVDEAHRSISTAYTALLEWLGLGRTRDGDRCTLIGLTATPFRGTSEDETKRLVGRYNANRLDAGALQGDQYRHLQEMGVLARVEHTLLAGTAIALTDEELAQLRQTRRLPARAEAAVGEDLSRNNRILESIRSLPSDWTILLFAASVEHAETLAALLTLDGLPAAVISSKTDSGARRHYVREFRAGRLRVLTNYGVFTEGFDAPAVRAVYVTRPTFSPNIYQQMIGRGLRGPLNGGKETCLIVNVEDNVLQFGEALAFTQFEYLWKAGD